MNIIAQHKIGIAQGEAVLFSDFEDGGVMWSGDGPRQSRATVVFERAFVAPPTMQVGLVMWDISNATFARMDVQAEGIAATGCDVVFRTWGDTKVARVRVSWLAIGAVMDDEDWDVI